MSNSAYEIYQDSIGNIWIGSDGGIIKYDGKEFITYSRLGKFAINSIFHIQPDPFGRIWFVSTSRVIMFYQDGEMQIYKHSNKVLEYFNNEIILFRSFHIAQNGDMYISTINKGIIKITPDGEINSLVPEPTDVLKTYGLYQQGSVLLPFTLIGKSENKELKFCTFIGGKSNEFYREKSRFINNLYVLSRKNGETIVAVSNYIFKMKDGQILSMNEHTNEIVSLFEDQDANLWIGYHSGGVKKYDKNSSLDDSLATEHYFDQISITSTLQDIDGNFWFSSLQKGVFYIPNMNVKTVFDYTNEFLDYHIMMMKKIKNDIYIGTVQGELFRYSHGRIKNLEIEKDAGSILVVFDKKDHIHIGTSKKRLCIKDEAITPCISSPPIHLSIYDRTGTLYECVQKRIYTVSPGSDTVNVENPDGIKFNTLFCDSRNRVWAATQANVHRLKNNKLTELITPGIKLTHVIDIAESNGKFFLGSATRGIIIISPDGIKILNTLDGLPTNTINKLVIQDDNTLWAATPLGLCKIRLEDYKIEMIINNKNGLPSSDVEMLELVNDTLYVASHNYLAFFNTHLVFPNNVNHPTILKKIRVNDEELMDTTKRIFTYDENNFEFNIHSYIYSEQGEIEYTYRLLGASEQFSHTNTNTIHYAHLSPGTYTFEAYALTKEKQPAGTSLHYTFTIRKPFWKTLWFYSISFTLLIVLVVLITSFYSARKNAAREIQLQLLESKQQAFANQMNPHFIFNALNSIQTYILVESKIEAAEYLSKFSKLMRLTLQNIRESWVNLGSEITLISHYIDLEKVRFPGITYQIEVGDGIDPSLVSIPSMLIQPFIENAIKHGITTKPDPSGHIHIRFIKEKDIIYCEVEDNGMGINSTGRSGKKEHVSTGIDITSARLKLICDAMKMPYYFEVSDINNQNQTGTKIRFAIPYKQQI